jgi:L-iditol 2-dehydrogenase
MAGLPKSMRVWQLVRPGELRLESVGVPEPGDGEILARVSVALTCATDLKTIDRGHARLKVPGPLGHEWAGSVAAVGKGVLGLTPGTRIVGTPTAPCGDCAYCLRGAENLCLHLFEHTALGAYGEYILIPRQIVNRNIYRRTSDDPDVHAAFLEPVACVLRGGDQLRLGGDRTIAFLGDGPMALIFVQLARLRGAGRIVVVGRHRRRLELARQLGADVTVDANERDPPEAVREVSDGLGADSVVECVGRPEAWKSAVSLVRRGGEVLFFGGCESGATVDLDTERVHYDELTLKGGFHYTPDCVRRAGELISSGNLKLEPLVTHEMSLDELPEAFELMRRREALKVAIVP